MTLGTGSQVIRVAPPAPVAKPLGGTHSAPDEGRVIDMSVQRESPPIFAEI